YQLTPILERRTEEPKLGMVGGHSEIGEKKGLAARLTASAARFNGDEYGVNLCEGFGIFRLQDPTLFSRVVFIENAETDGLLEVRAATTPSLKRLVSFAVLLIKVICIKDQRLFFRVEQATVRFAGGTLFIGVIHLGDVEIPCAHYLANVTIMRQQFVLLIQSLLPILQQPDQIFHFRPKGFGLGIFA